MFASPSPYPSSSSLRTSMDLEAHHDLIYGEEDYFSATTTSNITPSLCYIVPGYVCSYGSLDDSCNYGQQYLVLPSMTDTPYNNYTSLLHAGCDAVNQSYSPHYVHPSIADMSNMTLATPYETEAYNNDFPPSHECEMMTTSFHGDQHEGMRFVARKKKAKAKKPSMFLEITVKSYTSKLHVGSANGDITISTHAFNRADFQVDYQYAKFFVIKPVSLTEVYKSVKYGVWSSSPVGNEKLNNAFREAQAIAGSSRTLCPVLLFFSVNGSSDFCGVAEMVGPIDIEKDMDFWSMDRWVGSFPVKWHILKDICSPTLRRMMMQNNEDKPATTNHPKEIDYSCGISMLKYFKHTTAEKCLLDNFRMLEEKEAKDLVNKRMYNLRRGSPHFVRTRPTCSTLQPKSDRMLTYRAIKKNKDLKDELQDLNLGGHQGSCHDFGELSSKTLNMKPALDVEETHSESLAEAHEHRVNPNQQSGFIYVGSMPIAIGK